MRTWIEFFLTRRNIVLFGLVGFFAAGIIAFIRLNIEAYPNPAPPILEIIAQSPGQSAEEMERYYTIPIEVGIATTPGLQYVRSVSLYGLTFVRAQFTYDTDYYFALQQTLNRLNALALPNNVQPQISPSSLTGEIYRYQVLGPPGMSSMDLRTLQDWVITRQFRTVPGVIDVVSWGGPTKEYHVDVDLTKLPSFHLTLNQVIQAISNSNINVGGRTLQLGQQSVNVRGIGLINSVDDINNIVITQVGGIPILVRDVASVEIGFTPRQGIAGRDDKDDQVLGIVLMNRGERTSDVVERVKAEADRINKGNILPAGVHIEAYYDRSTLVSVTTHTVLHNLIFGICLVFLIQWLFLGNLRSAIIVAATIPFALFFSIIILVIRGDSANLLSIGAVDFGIIVDSTVILIENVFRALRRGDENAHAEMRRIHESLLVTSMTGKVGKILRAALEVDRAILFATLITVAAFIPLFTMQGVEGQIFSPMARTYGYALAGALLATFTVSPALASLLMPKETDETETLVVRGIRWAYTRALRWSMEYRKAIVGISVVLLIGTGIVIANLGTEFLPALEEGNLWIRASLPPTISLEAGIPVVAKIRDILRSYPEVVTVVSQHGRPDDGTDAAGLFNAEFFAPLTPQDTWPKGMTKDKLIRQMQDQLERELVGVSFNFSQYIQDNVEEALSGVKGANSVKLFGPDLDVLEQKANEIKDVMAQVRGVEDLGVFTVVGQPNLLISVDRARAARYGLATGDVNAVVQSAIAGQAATSVFEGEKQFPLVVRLAEQYRNSIDDIRHIQVAATSPNGDIAYLPLTDVATITLKSGASYIYREQNARYIPLKFSVRNRDLGGTVAEAQERVDEKVQLPEGYHVVWSGEFGALQAAEKRLAIIVPVSLLLIFGLLYAQFNNLRDCLLALAGIPFAVCGSFIALMVSGENFGVSAAVGFVSLFGVNVMDGILVMTYFNELVRGGYKPADALKHAAELRMRPVLMTSMSACIGLLPAALSTGIGSQVQRPLAIAVVGGMLLEPFLSLLILPVLRSYVVLRIPSRASQNPTDPPPEEPT
jgi:heavy metal efflux system protein